MAQFCDGCPVAGACSGAIVKIEGGNFEHNRSSMGLILRWEDNLIQIIECYDDSGNASALMQDIDADTLLGRVEGCSGPEEIKRKRLFRKPKLIKVCGGLGIRPNVASWYKEHYEKEKKRQGEDGSSPAA